jgi:hypothetical protein
MEKLLKLNLRLQQLLLQISLRKVEIQRQIHRASAAPALLQRPMIGLAS